MMQTKEEEEKNYLCGIFYSCTNRKKKKKEI